MAPANDFFLVAQTLAEEVGTIRARVVRLETALSDVVTRCSGRAGESDFARWHRQTAADIGEMLNTARAALKGE